MIKFVCVLKLGGDFNIHHVTRLRDMVDKYCDVDHEFICLSDEKFDVSNITRMDLELNLPGWWSMLEMFKVPGPVIYMDLDTTVRDTMSPLIDVTLALNKREVILLRPWNIQYQEENIFATGVTTWNCDLRKLYVALANDLKAGRIMHVARVGKESHINKHGHLVCGKHTHDTDQHYITKQLRDASLIIWTLQDLLPRFVQSYKKDIRKKREKATGSLIIFHGNPRPWDIDQ